MYSNSAYKTAKKITTISNELLSNGNYQSVCNNRKHGTVLLFYSRISKLHSLCKKQWRVTNKIIYHDENKKANYSKKWHLLKIHCKELLHKELLLDLESTKYKVFLILRIWQFHSRMFLHSESFAFIVFSTHLI